MSRKPKTKTGFSRVWAAFFYSLNGLRFAVSSEAAFRQELCAIVTVLVILFFLPLSPLWKGLLFFATTSVAVVELLNSSIESVVDITSPEFHILAKRAKDMGSAAVLVSIIVSVILWGGAMSTIF